MTDNEREMRKRKMMEADKHSVLFLLSSSVVNVLMFATRLNSKCLIKDVVHTFLSTLRWTASLCVVLPPSSPSALNLLMLLLLLQLCSSTWSVLAPFWSFVLSSHQTLFKLKPCSKDSLHPRFFNISFMSFCPAVQPPAAALFSLSPWPDVNYSAGIRWPTYLWLTHTHTHTHTHTPIQSPIHKA